MAYYGQRGSLVSNTKQSLQEHSKTPSKWTDSTGSDYLSSPLGDHFGGAPLNKYEHSVYAAPIPTPAPRATEAQRVVGLPVKKKCIAQHVNICNPIVQACNFSGHLIT